MENISKNVEVYDIETEGVENEILKILTFDLVKPISIDGYLGLFDSSVTIVMDNKDVIKWQNESDPAGKRKCNNVVIINHNKTEFNEGDEDMFYEIRKLYKEHLMRKIKL